jgi:hypothetical protein
MAIGDLSPGFTAGAFFCRARLFHWIADAVPLCRRKPATKGGKAVVPLLTHLRSEDIHSARPPQRLPSPGTAILAGAFLPAADSPEAA